MEDKHLKLECDIAALKNSMLKHDMDLANLRGRTFNRFPKLAIELRCKIYRYALNTDEERIIGVKFDYMNYSSDSNSDSDLEDESKLLIFVGRNHAFLSANRESRAEALKVLIKLTPSVEYRVRGDEIAYFNPEIDTYCGLVMDEEVIDVDDFVSPCLEDTPQFFSPQAMQQHNLTSHLLAKEFRQ